MAETPTILQGQGIGIHQKRKLFELRNQYTLVDQTGQVVGAAEQVRQGWITILARIFSDWDVALPSTIAVQDTSGQVVMELHKPWFRMTVYVDVAGQGVVGTVRKRIKLGKARFEIEDPNGQALGSVQAQNWRARDFSVRGDGDREVAQVTKQWRGLLTEAFTDADSYAVTFDPATVEPMRSLAFASALAVDLVMKQKDAG